jgi:glyoxylase-like metal-dependent hydrolase (beta-lactamase superfamily II)
MRVTDGVFRVDHVEGNAYVVVTDDGLLQVDSGLPGNARRICRFIEAIGHDPGEVHDIVLTHYDGDHVGSAAALKARTGARVCIHEADAPVLTREQKPGERMPLFVRILYRLLMKPLTPDRLLHDGDMVGGLRVLHIPGHTPGSIALVRDDGVVFSGDALLCDKHGNVIPPDPRLAEDPDQATHSAEAIQALQPRLLLPGHGSPAAASTYATATDAQAMADNSDTETVSGGHARRLLRRFDRFMPLGLLVDQYGEPQGLAMRQEMDREYLRLMPGVPHIGKDGTSDGRFLAYGPMALAVYRVVLRHGGDVEEAGRLLHECGRAFYQRMPTMVRPVLRWYLFSGLRRRRLEKAARDSQERRYPADWVFEIVPGDGQSFDYGKDVTECGIVKYLHAQGADELAPYLCEWDYIMAETLGIQLRRTKTLAWGCDRCDFRMTRDGTTTAPWPPEFVERTCGLAPSTASLPQPVEAS